MNQKGLLIGAAVLLLGLFGILAFSQGIFQNLNNEGDPLDEYPREGVAEGAVLDTAASAKVITIRTEGTEMSVAATSETKFFDKNGKEVAFTYIRRGFAVRAEGTYTRADSLRAETVRVTSEPNIIVYSPVPNEEVGLPVVIRGEARTFESNVQYRILNKDGSLLTGGFTTAESPDVGVHGPFEIRATYPKPKTSEGIIEVFEGSAMDGSEINKVTIPVRFKTAESTTVKAYFSNRVRDPNAMNCGQVYSVERRIEKTEAVARRALEELLEGPTTTEGQQGFFTSINAGVKIKDLTIVDGTARVDFDGTIEAGMGGSCRVTAVRAQIVQTLKQFPTVQNVIISVDGRTEDILQP